MQPENGYNEVLGKLIHYKYTYMLGKCPKKTKRFICLKMEEI